MRASSTSSPSIRHRFPVAALTLLAITGLAVTAAAPAQAAVAGLAGGGRAAVVPAVRPSDPPGGTILPDDPNGYGPATDPASWAECQLDHDELINAYPPEQGWQVVCFAYDGHVYLGIWPRPKVAETWINAVNPGLNRVLEINHSATADGGKADIWEYNGSNTQWWFRWRMPDGYYQIFNGNSGKCLGINGGSTSSQALAIQWLCNGNQDQEWSFAFTGRYLSGYPVYNIINHKSGLCLDLPHSTTTNGTQLWQYVCNDTNAQGWF